MMRFALVLAVLLSVACATGYQTSRSTSLPTQCHAQGALPDAGCTPGATNPAVTQDTIGATICTKGWTATIRPPVSYTEPLKKQQIAAYGYSDTKLSDYEEDHLISLELGGSPTDPKNLWPEAHSPAPGSFQKDALENYLNKQICSGAMTLTAAQQAIATDWVSAWQKAGQP